jgi:hypothetical protein
MNLESKEKPKWYNVRWKLSNIIINIGRKIYPDNPEWKAFIMQQAVDQMLYGGSITRVDPLDFKDKVK